jgi:hypothetical protein
MAATGKTLQTLAESPESPAKYLKKRGTQHFVKDLGNLPGLHKLYPYQKRGGSVGSCLNGHEVASFGCVFRNFL